MILKECEDKIMSTLNTMSTNQTLSTRLGPIQISEKNSYYFPQGLYGFEEFHSYVIDSLPGLSTDKNLLLLQSLENTDLSFILLKFEVNSCPSEWKTTAEQIHSSLQAFNLDPEEVIIGLVVTIHHGEAAAQKVYVNLEAPLIFSPKRQQAWQIILNYPNES